MRSLLGVLALLPSWRALRHFVPRKLRRDSSWPA